MNICLVLLLGFSSLAYASAQVCQKEFQSSRLASVSKKEIARVSRANFVQTAAKTIIYRVLSVSKKSDSALSYRERKTSVWLKRLQRDYKSSQSVLPLERLESILNHVESVFGPFKADDSDLVFTENGSWLKNLSDQSQEERIGLLKEMIQMYNEDYLHEFNSQLKWHSDDFAHFFKVVVFSYLMRFPAEQLKEFILNHLDHKSGNKIYYYEHNNSPLLKKIEAGRDMRVFLYNLVQSMDSVLLKNIIMKELFITMRIYAIYRDPLIQIIAPKEPVENQIEILESVD